MGIGQNVGYIRVSTAEQNTARQLAGIKLDKVFMDQVSGKNAERPALHDCLLYLRENDTLHVHSVDRLARNLQDLLNITSELIKRGVKIVFHKENLSFDSMDNHVQMALLQFMGLIAELERKFMLDRQREGIAIARAAGKYKGRKPLLTPDQVKDIRKMHAAKFSIRKIAKRFCISYSAVRNALGIGASNCYANIE